MMIKLFKYRILFIILVLFTACGERNTASDVDSLNLRFRVKTLNESFYLAYNSFNQIVLQKKIYEYSYEFDYDCKYKSIEKKFFIGKALDSENNAVTVDSFETDSIKQNRIIIDSVYSDSLIIDSINIDSLKNVFPFVMKEADYLLIKYDYRNDTLTVQEFYDKDENLIYYINKTFKNNKLYSEEKFSADGKLISKTGFWYDKDNRLINKTVFFETGYSEILYSYSPGEKVETDNDLSYRYKYDIDGKIVNKKTYKGTAQISETTYTYNDKGDLLIQQEISKEGEIKKTLYEYVYDEKNNWTICMENNYSGNIFVKKREITYYQ